MVDLSIIIVSYNTAKMTKDCLEKLLIALDQNPGTSVEVIVVDNASKDETRKTLANLKAAYEKKGATLIIEFLNANLGYSKANNRGLSMARGKYVLFLNSDVMVDTISFKNLILRFAQDKMLGALTVKVVLENGRIDPASHRGFPTLWRSFCYYAGLERIFGKVPVLDRVFGGYHLTHLDPSTEHEIDSPTGAFYMAPKHLLDKVAGFDESFFMYGEDLDLSFRIKEAGYKILYVPTYTVTHLKYQSGIKSTDESTKSKTKGYFYDAMKIFYKKHYEAKTPGVLNWLAYFVINQKEKRP